MSAELDRADAAILEALQRNGRLTSQELAEEVRMSPSQCARRRQRLEEEGYIVGYRAVVDRRRVGVPIEVFIQVVMANHSQENAATFVELVQATPEILDAWTLTGSADYLLRVAVTDLDALSRLISGTLLRHPIVSRVQSQIVLVDLKSMSPVRILASR